MINDMWIALIAAGWSLFVLACCAVCGAGKREMPAAGLTPIDEVAGFDQPAVVRARFQAIINQSWPELARAGGPDAGIA